MSVSDTVTITGTTDYNGTGIAINFVTGLTFNITDTWVSNQSGTWLNENPLPDGWAPVLTPTYSYTDPSDDTDYGDGVYLTLTNSGANNEGAKIFLINLDSDSTYKVLARAKDDGVGTCDLDVTNEGGAAFSGTTSTTTDVWETLSGTFGTTAGAVDTVEITLTTDDGVGANQACQWDHVTVFRTGDTTTDRDELSEPGTVIIRDISLNDNTQCDTTDYSGLCADIVALTFTPPKDSLVTLTGKLGWGVVTQDADCKARIQSSVGGTIDESGLHGEVNIHLEEQVTLVGYELVAAGTTVTYTLDLDEFNAGAGVCRTRNTGAFTNQHVLQAVITPTR
jgi:hypothetical protein